MIMPITKIPVVHKFGIISSTQRLQLQERLHRKAFFDSNTGKKPSLIHRKPLDVTDGFVQLFNTAENFNEKEQYEGKAKKFLERAKRRSGVKNYGCGDYVNLPLAWTEMAQLAQCKGSVQEECLDLLVTSLDVSPLERYQIPALFYLAETILYCLRMEELNYPFLRTTEIKLLKVGQLVFERLFYHHMVGQLQEHGESKNRLCTYMDGLDDLQNMYSPYPNALLFLRFVIDVGKIILTESQVENMDTDMNKLSSASEQNSQDVRDIYEYYSHVETRSSRSRAISSSVHDLSPTLWHALDVFRCTNSLGSGLKEALMALESCGFDMVNETWVDGVIALQVLGESAKTNLAAQKVLHRLAQRVLTIENMSTTLPLGSNRSSQLARPPASDGHGKAEIASALQENKLWLEMSSSNRHMQDDCDNKKEQVADMDDHVRVSGNIQVADLEYIVRPSGNMQTADIDDSVRLPGFVSANENDQLQQMPGMFDWYWEIAQTYTEVLENIVLFGSTSAVQKYALIGGQGISEFHCHGQANLGGLCLVDLAFYKPESGLLVKEMKQVDWSWRIRFTAMQSLGRICQCLKDDKTREGLRSIAWSALLKANAKEKDVRVTEALKVSQIHIDSKKFLDPSLQEHPVSLGQRIAIGLSTAYLPPIPPAGTQTSRERFSHRPHPATQVPSATTPAAVKPQRVTLKQEIDIAAASYEPIPNYITRKNFDLRRIIDTQWDKELSAMLEEEEKEHIIATKERQQSEDERQKLFAESRRLKIQKKSSTRTPAQQGEESC
ncbi:unnamed protein product [Candidula unifasciata]|uniref:Transmembrane protein 232 n=1 Tax=Candidula unifasciata TaxID=100452 RepID=A0A8S3ZAD0_9EUPU|nr:unnamed protein product [Candidula unifasciata]